MLSKIFKKKNITSRTIEDNSQNIRIPFRNQMGGVLTRDYQIEKGVRQINRKLKKHVNQLIQKGTVDEFTTPAVFDRLVDAYFALCHNEVEKTGVYHAQVIQSIRAVQQSERLINMREADIAMKVIDGAANAELEKENREVRDYEKINHKNFSQGIQR